jgi:hypothetical protein
MLGRKQVSPGYFPFKTIESATNCILEIPQNLKLELENNVLTYKQGTTVVLVLPQYTTITYNSDLTYDFSNSSDGRYVVFSVPYQNSVLYPTNINAISSGTENPSTGSGGDRFFNVNDMRMYSRGPDSWNLSNICYPSCVIDVINGVASFAKDSNGNDIIFNGFGFIGQTKYILPGVRMLLSAGKYDDGTNRNIIYTSNSLQLSTSGGSYIRRIFIRDGTLQLTTNAWYYDNSTNLWYDQSGYPLSNGCVYLGDCNTLNGIVTNFTINPPLGYWRYFVKMIQ